MSLYSLSFGSLILPDIRPTDIQGQTSPGRDSPGKDSRVLLVIIIKSENFHKTKSVV